MNKKNRLFWLIAAVALLPAISLAESSTPRVSYDSTNNKYLVSYYSGSSGAYYLNAKILGANGTASGGAFSMWSASILYDTPAPVVYDQANQRWIMAWTPSPANVYLRLINPDGSIYNLDGDSTSEVGGDYTVLTSSGFSPEIAIDPVNGLVLAVMMRVDTGAVIGQFVGLDGATAGANFNVHAGTGDKYHDYAVTYDSVYQRFLVVLVREPGSGGTYEIDGQFAGLHGSTVGNLTRSNVIGSDLFQITSASAERPLSPAIAFSGGDRFLTVWQDGKDRINGQLIDNGGMLRRRDGLQGFDPFTVSNQKGANENPCLIFDPDRETFLAGFQNAKRTSFSAQGQELTADGILYGSFPEINFTIAATGSYLEKVALAHNSTDQNNLAVFEYSGVSGHEVGAALADPATALPLLLSPADGASLSTLSTTLTWKKLKDPSGTAMTYTVMLCDNPDVTVCLPYAVKTARNDYPRGLAFPIAAGVFALGMVLIGSPVRKRAAIFIACMLIGGSLTWLGCTGGSGGGDDSSSTTPVLSVKANNLFASTTYYWRIEAESKDGSVEFESETRSFNTP